MCKRIWLLSLCVLFSVAAFASDKAVVLELNGAISPASQDFFKRGLNYAESQHAKLVILKLNTPGGLETSMRGITEAIIASPIPVITLVSPSGARAASAGTFIVYASHVAAMASGTNIGAASPINLMGTDKTTKKLSTEEQKASNDAVAYIRSLAELRKRNADWAESAVRQAASISAEEAKKLHVIDLIAQDYTDLLKGIDGREVSVRGKPQKINSQNLQIETVQPDWRYEFLNFITNPTIAYLLMLVAVYGLFFELSNPGLVMPGVVGIIALLLVLYAFQLIPVNYAGLILVLLGIAFMIFEVIVSSFGVIGLGGIIAFMIGSVMLFDIHDPNFRITLTLIVTMGVITFVFFFMVLSLAIRSHKRAIVTGHEGLIGREGTVISMMNEQVIVRVLGEIWEARSPVMLTPGQKIKVKNVKGLMLFVEPKENKK